MSKKKYKFFLKFMKKNKKMLLTFASKSVIIVSIVGV